VADKVKSYDLDSLPEDLEVNASQSVEYAPIDPSEMYQVEIVKIEARETPSTWKDTTDKYRLSFEFAILNDGENYGRRLWSNAALAMKPARDKYEATTLYKIVTAALNSPFDWDACASFAANLSENLKETILGKQIKVAIENVVNPETGKTKSKIKTYYPIKTKLPKFDQEKSKKIGEEKKAQAQAKEAAVSKEDPLPGGLDFDKVMDDLDQGSPEPTKK
jgi:hypothetical protein